MILTIKTPKQDDDEIIVLNNLELNKVIIYCLIFI